MYKPNIINNVLVSKWKEIKTHLNHQLSFSPYSNKGHILVGKNFYEFEIDKNGDLYSPSKIKGYDYYKNKSYLGNYNNLTFSGLTNPKDENIEITPQESIIYR